MAAAAATRETELRASLEVGSPFSLLPAPFSQLPAPGSLAAAPSSQLPAHVSMPLPWQKVKTAAKTAARTAAATANASAEQQRQQRVAIFSLEVGSPPTAPAPSSGSRQLPAHTSFFFMCGRASTPVR